MRQREKKRVKQQRNEKNDGKRNPVLEATKRPAQKKFTGEICA